MKIIYSQLKKFLPNLKKTAQEVANDLTMIGHFNDSFEIIEGEKIIGLEIRQNRGDCLGYYGIAKELSVLYNIPLTNLEITLPKTKVNYRLPIKIKAKKQTHRILAIKISGLRNHLSPQWLKKIIGLHDINSINTLVDLTNYAMLLYGLPCHAFDTNKSTDQLVWELNNGQYQKFTTLDNSQVALEKDTFLISDPSGASSLVILGGKRSAIKLNTKETIIEMAIYDREKVRKDSKNLNISTEASIRLEKDLDPELIPQAFKHLIKLVLDNCGGEITSNLYDYYSQKPKKIKIPFDSKKPSAYSGIEIPKYFSTTILKKLGCKINGNLVVPPTIRKDIKLEEDLIEEVIRFYGYDRIPINEPINKKPLPDITPKILYLIENIREILIRLGYDEVRSWPLIQKKYLYKNKDLDRAKTISTENNINSNFPILRQSIISSLKFQKAQYQKLKLPQPQFFEIGKVFYQKNGQYQEHFSLGIYHPSRKTLKSDLKELLKKLAVEIKIENDNFAEINLEKLLKKMKQIAKIKLSKNKSKAVQELTKQIISLDANVILKNKETPKKLIKKYANKIGNKYLWQLVITDIYQDEKRKEYKYTFRAYYYNLDDKTAKKIHLKAFGLV